jgi:acetamidase/formamidase
MTVHHFTPRNFYGTFGAHPPALRIHDGDTVITTTVDNYGCDAAGTHLVDAVNPQTGPFYIEGAELGDTLAVYFNRMAPHRERAVGYSGAVLAPHVVDPSAVRDLPVVEDRRAAWRFDHTAGTATLERPDSSLNGITLPLQPMLGCLGVAPERGQFIGSMTSGRHGGNMDYRGFCQGTTAYFPVFEPGALFHLGDGHALQGHGEVTGMGIEAPFEVQFTVRVLKGKKIGWPRGEDEAYIFTAGNARPLDQALQHATTEMAAWLVQDYGFDPLGANTLLGVCVEYEIGNVYDPAYTVVCKMSKRFLAPLSLSRAISTFSDSPQSLG